MNVLSSVHPRRHPTFPMVGRSFLPVSHHGIAPQKWRSLSSSRASVRRLRKSGRGDCSHPQSSDYHSYASPLIAEISWAFPSPVQVPWWNPEYHMSALITWRYTRGFRMSGHSHRRSLGGCLLTHISRVCILPIFGGPQCPTLFDHTTCSCRLFLAAC